MKVAGTGSHFLSECTLWGEGGWHGASIGCNSDLSLTGQRSNFSIKQSLSLAKAH